MSETHARRCGGLLSLVLLVGALLATGNSAAQPYGLDVPQPVGPYLDGVFPTLAPQSPGSSTWEVIDAFGFALPNTLVIERNPSDNRLYVGSRDGVVRSFENDELLTEPPDPFMDISDRVAVVWDGGFLGLAFHPDFGTPGADYETTFFAYYSSYCPTKLEGSEYVNDFANCNPTYPQSSTGGFFNTWLRLSRFEAYWDSTLGVWRGDPSSEIPLFNIRLYNGSHRGGGPVFGNDGYLYVAIGDQFRYETAQDIVNNFEGGSVRLEVEVEVDGVCPAGSHAPLRFMQDVTGNVDEMTGQRYCIPDDNPWPGLSGETFGEYNSIGHRNPHRIALDPVTGLLWSGEVGQSTREEVNVIITGRNYQWPYMEGLTTGVRSKPSTVIGVEQPPVVDFTRTEARTIIGGYVYRGTRFPELSGRYIAGDYSTNNIWAITLDINTMTATKELLTSFPSGALGTFGQDNAGEIFMGDVFATIPLQRLNRIGDPVPDPPALLSQTGAFVDTASFQVNPAGIPYDLVPFWSDNAIKSRWLFLPNDGTHDAAGEQIVFSPNANWGFPNGTVAMKHFELGIDENDASARVRLETRFVVKDENGDFYGVTYRWREDQIDADLLSVAETGDYTIQLAGGGTRQQTWLYPSRAECLQCHTDGAGAFLGLRTHQQNRDLTYPRTGRTDNQLRTWNALGMFTPPLDEAAIPGYLRSAQLDDPTESLETRVRSWLDSNCANCHRPDTGNRAGIDLRFTTPVESQGMVYGGVLDDLGLPDAYIVSPGDISNSVLRARVAAFGGAGIQMPPLAKQLAHTEALSLIDEWILRIDPSFPRTGIDYEYYELTGMSVLPDFDSLTPVATGTVPTFDISVRQRNDDFAFRFSGYVDIPTSGIWTFYTSSDDGSQLFIDGALVVDNDGLHANRELAGSVNLSAGAHDIVVTMFERGGQEVLTVSWEGPGQAKQFIPGGRISPEPIVPNANEPPVLASPGSQSSVIGTTVYLALQALDPDDSNLYFDAVGLPEGLTIDHATGEIAGLLTASQAGTALVVASVSDGPAVSHVTFDWTLTAGNAPPNVIGPPDQVAHEGDSISLAIQADDPENDPLTFSATGLPPDLSIDPDNGEITGTIALGTAGFYGVDAIVSDGFAFTTVSFTLTVIGPPPTGGIVGDDFHAGVLDTQLWEVVDPQGDGTVTLVGAGTPDAHLLLSVSAGVEHDPWSTNTSLRVMQPAADEDFELEVKFESEPTQQYQGQGLLVEQDVSNYIRFDVFYGGGALRVFAATISNSSPSIRINSAISSMATTYLRLGRVGDQWTAQYSDDGVSWTTAGSFSHVLGVTSVGVFASNFTPNPAWTTRVDYFMETSAPIVTEDPPLCDPGNPLLLTTSASVGGTISVSPDQPSYMCGDVVMLTAEPDFGATFLGWGGALSGTTNPATLTLQQDEAVTASFQPDETAPIISGVVVTPGNTTASLAWQTNELSTGTVEWGLTPSYEQVPVSAGGLSTSHGVDLDGLAEGTLHYYRINAQDQFGNLRTQAGTFTTNDPLDTTPPVISGVVATAGPSSATVSWSTDELSTGLVEYGQTLAYELGMVQSTAPATSHSVVLPTLDASTVYHYRITAADALANAASTGDATFITDDLPDPGGEPGAAGIVGDDFHAGVLDTQLWEVVDPQGDGTVTLVGAGTPDAHLLLSVSAGVEHDPWSTNTSLRVMQPAADEDFELEVKFESEPTQQYQGQGLLVEQDVSNYIRFDVFYGGGALRVFAATISNSSPSIRINSAISSMATTYLRLGRVGDQWTAQYSDDGVSWTTAGSFSHVLGVTSVGVFASNFTPNPAWTTRVDYFMETSAPIVTEDPPLCDPGNPLLLTTSASVGGTISVSPDQPSYMCGDVVMLTAEPDFGATFLGWGGALSGTTNPATLTLQQDEAVTASFQPDETAPIISGVVVTPGNTTASLAWQTNELSTGTVEWGLTPSYEQVPVSAGGLSTSHGVDLDGLAEGTLHYYRINAQDQFGNLRTQAGTFTTNDPLDTTPPVISGVVATAGPSSATVSWSTDELSTGLVEYGQTLAYELGMVQSTAPATSHSVVLPTLDASTVYHYRITAADALANAASTGDATFITDDLPDPGGEPGAAGIVSDEFDTGAMNTALWTIVDPRNDGAVSVDGGGSLLLSVPAGVEHDPWSTNTSLRVMQPAADEDFELEVKFESEPTQQYQGQGLLVEQDVSNYIRFDVFYGGGALRVFAATIDSGAPSTRIFSAISPGATTYLRLARIGESWIAEYSYDGSNWISAGSFAHTLTVSAVGVFASNFTPNPAYTAEVDYFRETSAP